MTAKTEALLTALGLLFGVAATLTALLHGEKPSITRTVLCLLALLGLGVGLATTYGQYWDRQQDEADALHAKQQRDELVSKVGDLQQVQKSIDEETADLTMLNKLGGGDYYLVMDTFQRNDVKAHDSCEQVTARLQSLYPDALCNGLLWTASTPGNPSSYQLRFGRNLTPSSAEIFQNLADRGLSNGNATIRRSGGGSPGDVVVANCRQHQYDICPH